MRWLNVMHAPVWQLPVCTGLLMLLCALIALQLSPSALKRGPPTEHTNRFVDKVRCAHVAVGLRRLVAAHSSKAVCGNVICDMHQHYCSHTTNSVLLLW